MTTLWMKEITVLNRTLMSTACVQCLHNQTRPYNIHQRQWHHNNHVYCRNKYKVASSFLQHKNLNIQSCQTSFSCARSKILIKNKELFNSNALPVLINRKLTVSPKTVLDASPKTIQPYLRLIRFDKPIGIIVVGMCKCWSFTGNKLIVHFHALVCVQNIFFQHILNILI